MVEPISTETIYDGSVECPKCGLFMTPVQAMYTDGTSINNLPMTDSMPAQQLPDYNNMYQQDSTPLVGAATPGMESFEPMAANAMSGGFGNAFSW